MINLKSKICTHFYHFRPSWMSTKISTIENDVQNDIVATWQQTSGKVFSFK